MWYQVIDSIEATQPDLIEPTHCKTSYETILNRLYDHYRAINSSSMFMQSEGETSRMEVDDDPQKLSSQ